mmetsp:Transcript_34331/g.90928  ORF Transcript_34331/g.90928 Transcript_34331/m.90928 type:complete len:624 (-) Transcript_34331:44-1915(-)
MPREPIVIQGAATRWRHCLRRSRSTVQRLGLVPENQHARQPEPEEQEDQDSEEQWGIVRVHVVGKQHVPAYHRVIKLAREDDVHAPLERAQVLHPPQELGHLGKLYEEARKQDLRHEEDGRQLLHRLHVRDGAACHQRHGGRRDADEEDGDEVEDELALQGEHRVANGHGDGGREEDQGDLNNALADEVRDDAVHPARVLAKEHGPLGGERQQRGLRGAEHPADADHRDAAHVRLQAVVGEALVADLPEHDAEEEAEEDRGAEAGPEGGLVADDVAQLALGEQDELRAEALAPGRPGQLQGRGRLRHAPGRGLPVPVLGDQGHAILVQLLEEVHDEVSGVVVLRALVAELGEVLADAGGGSLVDDLAAGEEDGAVEELEDLRARLVDGAHDRLVQLRQLLQQGDDVVGRGGIQAARRLVKEGDLGVRDQLGADGGALLLAAGDALDQRVAHHGVRALRQAEGVQHVRQQGLHLLGADVRQAQLCRKLQDLARRGGREERVLLHHVAEEVRLLVRLDHIAVDRDLAADARLAPGADAAGQDVHEARLAGARRAQDARELAGLQVAGDAVQDSLAGASSLCSPGVSGEAEVGPGQRRGLLRRVMEGEDLRLLRCLGRRGVNHGWD